MPSSQFNMFRDALLKSLYILNASKHEANVVGGLGNGWTTTENGEGREISTSLYRMNVDSNYFQTYSMQLAAGRFFSHEISSDTSKAVLVNEAAVKTFGWKYPETAIGKRFGKGNDEQIVIGVVKDFNFENLHKPVEALLIGYAKEANAMSVKIDTRHMDEAITHLKKTWAAIGTNSPLQYDFVDESIAQQYGSEQKMERVFYGFAGLSVVIACLGLFGLSLFVVERKVKEIGIRKVLGASVPGIVKLLSKDFLQLVFIAAVIACPLAYYFMYRWLQDFAYRINIGWQVFLVAGTVAGAVAMLTISFRSVKAAMANPVKSLRIE
jgi:putative ABC transport system permease protein